MIVNEVDVHKINDIFSAYKHRNTPGFAIGILNGNGEIIYQAGFGQANLEHTSQITQNTVFDIGSMAKQFIGFLFVLLFDEGLLSPAQKISSIFSSWPKFYKKIEIQHLLSHMTGKIVVKNKNPHFCSLDLIYTPTIPDYFESYDPHPFAMFIAFRRIKSVEETKAGKIVSFVYRDYDGDKREEFEFKKL